MEIDRQTDYQKSTPKIPRSPKSSGMETVVTFQAFQAGSDFHGLSREESRTSCCRDNTARVRWDKGTEAVVWEACATVPAPSVKAESRT